MNNNRKYKRIGCVANLASKVAAEAFKKIMSKYDFFDANDRSDKKREDYDLIVALGGDGFMLKVLHQYIGTKTPIYGLNRGSIGFLMNKYNDEDLIKKLEDSKSYELHPLEMTVETLNGEVKKALAINEVSLLRETNQAARIQIFIDGKEMLTNLICDGILVSTPAGSTAYNFAAHGPIVPLDASILAITPISPFRPRRWGGALVSHKNLISLKILSPEKRPVSAVADFHEIRDVSSVSIIERQDIKLQILFDSNNNIEDRIIKEQFII